MDGQNAGKIIIAEENGRPVLTEHPEPEPVKNDRAVKPEFSRTSINYAPGWSGYRVNTSTAPKQPSI